MRIIALTDLHSSTAGLDAIAEDLSKADLVLLAGDLTNFGDRDEAERVIDEVRRYNASILAVTGNCDRPGVGRYLREEGINLHGRAVVRDGVAFLGVGGSLPCPGRTPNEMPEQQFYAVLTEAFAELEHGLAFVLVSHQPPHDTVADSVPSGAHVGSTALRRFIEERRPIACFCGHIHEGQGTDMIGETRVVNPGPLRDGGYACAEIDETVHKLQIRQWR